MAQYDNPAGRLYELLSRFTQAVRVPNPNVSVEGAWSSVLGVPVERLVDELSDVAGLVKSTREAADWTGRRALQNRVKRYEPEWATAIFPRQLAWNQSAMSVAVSDQALEALDSVADSLSTLAPEGKIPEPDELSQLADDVQDVITGVQATERMAVEVKELLVDRLSDVLKAVRQVAVGGPNAVNLAVKALLGTVVLDAERPTDSDRGEAEEESAAGSILKTRRQILKLGAAVSAAFALGPKIQEDAGAWENILEGHIGSPAELTAAPERKQLPAGIPEKK
ncbi:MAG: hypothetical protein M3065_10810 [Actinomycetota bacterium]|nr:hypothetical protein [Actinomycetota bacterium]